MADHAASSALGEQPGTLLRISDVSAQFTSRLGRLDALESVTFSVARGEFVCLIGPSGCGKSTLLRLVAGLIEPASGEIVVGRAGPLTPAKRGGKRRIGLVFQEPTLLPWRTVAANVALPLALSGARRDDVDRRVAELLGLVGLSDFAGEYPANLSGGMAQRVSIARALCQDPQLLLLDEPFGALDALTREYMAVELLRIWERSQPTVLMVTHNVEEAALLSDRVVVLSPRPGRVTAVVEVGLPRPRTPDLLMGAPLQAVAKQLRKALAHKQSAVVEDRGRSYGEVS